MEESKCVPAIFEAGILACTSRCVACLLTLNFIILFAKVLRGSYVNKREIHLPLNIEIILSPIEIMVAPQNPLIRPNTSSTVSD